MVRGGPTAEGFLDTRPEGLSIEGVSYGTEPLKLVEFQMSKIVVNADGPGSFLRIGRAKSETVSMVGDVLGYRSGIFLSESGWSQSRFGDPCPSLCEGAGQRVGDGLL